jgi:hypothetical protein
MIRAALWSMIVLGWLAVRAPAAPLARQRVVLADDDAELRRAIERALAPWHLVVVLEGPPPADAAEAQQRAIRDTARFVVWRAGGQLVVYDRELDSVERRTSRTGALDPPTAAAAALTVKTMMRLPAPADEPPPDKPPADEPPADLAAPALPAPVLAPATLRVEAGAAARIASGDASTTPRIAAGVALRPWPTAWWLGLAGDGGPSLGVSRAGFKGGWSEWSVRATVGRALGLDAGETWQLEPALALGVRHSSLDGAETGAPRSESATLADAQASVAVRWCYAGWSVGAVAMFGVTLAAPTYIKTGAAAEIFQVPGSALELGARIGRDL